MSTHLEDLGFLYEPEEFLDKMEELVKESLGKMQTVLRFGELAYYVVPVDANIDLWFKLEDQTVHYSDFDIRYKTSRCFLLHEPAIDAEQVSHAVAGSLVSAWVDSKLYPMNMDACNIEPSTQFDDNKKYKCQMVCLSDYVCVYEDEEAYYAAVRDESGEPCIGSKCFIPCGTFPADPEEESFEENATSLIYGIVVSAERRENGLTGDPYYFVTVDSVDAQYDLLIAASDVDDLPQPGNVIEGQFYLTGRIDEIFAGSEHRAMKSVYPIQGQCVTLETLYLALRRCWEKETTYPDCRDEWVVDDPSYGQGSITVMVVQDLFGGNICSVRSESGDMHYFNQIDGVIVDLTSEQYAGYMETLPYAQGEPLDRTYLEQDANTLERYNRLNKKLQMYFAGKATLL